MLAIWFMGAVFIWAFSFYWAGRFEPTKEGFNVIFNLDTDVMWFGGIIGLIWPVAIVVFMVLLPFALLYKLGAKSRAKAAAKKTVD